MMTGFGHGVIGSDRRAGEKSEEADRLSGLNFFAEKRALASCDSRYNLNF